jgi:hypothetical protein
MWYHAPPPARIVARAQVLSKPRCRSWVKIFLSLSWVDAMNQTLLSRRSAPGQPSGSPIRVVATPVAMTSRHNVDLPVAQAPGRVPGRSLIPPVKGPGGLVRGRRRVQGFLRGRHPVVGCLGPPQHGVHGRAGAKWCAGSPVGAAMPGIALTRRRRPGGDARWGREAAQLRLPAAPLCPSGTRCRRARSDAG